MGVTLAIAAYFALSCLLAWGVGSYIHAGMHDDKEETK